MSARGQVPTSPKVSIILPTYNRASYIIDTIESVRAQTYRHWELIVVDDGSDDATGELISHLHDDRIRVYALEHLGRGTSLKNIGLANAAGDLIAFIDSDDLWSPSKIDKQVRALEDYPDAGFSLTGGYTFRRAGEPIDYFCRQRDGVKCDNILISLFKSELAAYTQALMVRRQCLDVAGRFPETKSFADVDFILSLARHFKAVVLYEPLVYRRIHDESHSQTNWKQNYDEGLEIIESYERDGILPSTIAGDAVFRLYMNLGERYLAYQKPGLAGMAFAKAWARRPYRVSPLKKIGKALLRGVAGRRSGDSR